MAPWIESHDEIWEHHKTIKLCAILGIEDVQAVGHLTSLWHFVLRNAWRDANLEAWGDLGIERASRWRKQDGNMVNALRESGFLDGFVVHGWEERAGKLVQDRLYNERRKHESVKRNKNAVKRRKADATLPYPTLPNPTLPNPTITDSGRTIPPKLEWVMAYCKDRGAKVDPDKFFAYYESNGWRVGRNPMKNWKACVHTWEKNSGIYNGNGNQKNNQSHIVGAAAPTPGKYDHL